jgi:(2Fe-2S) ferredoxin
MTKLTNEKLDEIKNSFKKKGENWVKVGMSTCGIAAGADTVFNVMTNEVKKRNLNVSVKKCGCAGSCFAEPLVEVSIEGMPQVIYGAVDEDTAREIIDKHICGKRLVNDHIYGITSAEAQA